MLCLSCSGSIAAQQQLLIQDYREGADDSVEGRVYAFDNTITYEGTVDGEESAVFQYDRLTGNIETVLTASDLGESIQLVSAVIDDALYVTTGPSIFSSDVYIATTADLADLRLLHEGNGNHLSQIWTLAGNTFIIDEVAPDFETVNFTYHNSQGSTQRVFEGLEGRGVFFNISRYGTHYFLNFERITVDGASIFAFDIEREELLEIGELLPTYQDCGQVRQTKVVGSVLYLNCNQDFLYDLDELVEISTEDDRFELIADFESSVVINVDGDLYELDKTTGAKQLIGQGVVSAMQAIADEVIALSTQFESVTLLQVKPDGQKLVYGLDLPSTADVSILDAEFVGGKVHVLVRNDTDNTGQIYSVDQFGAELLATLSGVNGLNNMAVNADELVYWHDDATVGKELFAIRYWLTSVENNKGHQYDNLAYPSPTTGSISIAAEVNAVSLTVQDLAGRVRYSAVPSAADLRGLPAGVYILEVTTDSGAVLYDKVVKI